jgi:hypothetical protein
MATSAGGPWTQVGTTAFPMGRSAHIGLAASSHINNTTTTLTATFDNVQ